MSDYKKSVLMMCRDYWVDGQQAFQGDSCAVPLVWLLRPYKTYPNGKASPKRNTDALKVKYSKAAPLQSLIGKIRFTPATKLRQVFDSNVNAQAHTKSTVD